MKKVIIIGVIAVLAIGGGYLLLHKNSSKTSTANTQTTSSSSTNTNQTAAATITYSNSGFSPSSTTVKSGDVVAIKNTSSGNLQIDSNPHPAHTDDTDLNVGEVAAGQTKTFTVTKTGTFSFHNHLNPSDTASITIQ